MKKLLKPSLISLILLATTHKAQALDLGYDFGRLDTVWQTIGGPNDKIFEEILGKYELSRIVAVDPQKGTITGTQCRPPRQCVSGQKPPVAGGSSSSTPDINSAVEFDIVRVSRPEYIQSIYQRYGLLSLYIAKNAQFNGVVLTEDDKARLDRSQAIVMTKQRTDAIRQQLSSAVLESYLLHLSQYYLAEDLDAKCKAMKSADALYSTSLKSINPASDLLPNFKPLYQQFIGFINSVQRNADRMLACTVVPTSTRAETVNAVNLAVAEEVNKALAVKVAATISLLDAADTILDCPDPLSDEFKKKSEFQKLACLKRGIDGVEFNLKDTFAMARNVKNIRANLDFIREAEPGVRTRQESLLKEAGLNSFYQPIAGVQPFPKLSNTKEVTKETATLQVLNDTIKSRVSAALTSLVALAGNLVPTAVPSCKEAKDLFDPSKLSNDNSLLQTFVSKTESCLIGLNDALKTRIVATDEDRLQEKLTQDVKSLSSEVQKYFDQNAIQIIDNLAN